MRQIRMACGAIWRPDDGKRKTTWAEAGPKEHRMTITQDLAKNVRSIFERDLPAQAIDKAKLAILDTIGVTLAGSCHEGATKLRNVIVPTAASGPAAVFGTSLRL